MYGLIWDIQNILNECVPCVTSFTVVVMFMRNGDWGL